MGDSSRENDSFEYDLFCFYRNLAKEQEELGPKFTKILYDLLDSIISENKEND